MSDPQDLIYQGSGISVLSPQLSARVQWDIITAAGQMEILTGAAPLPLQPDLGVSLLMAYQCEKKEAVAEAHEPEGVPVD